jgi:uncharacterized protein
LTVDMINMKKFLTVLLLLVTVVLFAQNNIPNRPNPPKLVNDFTNTTLTASQKDELERKLYQYDDTTSNQIAIVIVNSLNGMTVEDYALELGRKWGVGNKDFNNGIVILVSTGGGDGNRDLTIAVGYGLERAIPDITAKQIIDHEMIPNFKAQDIYGGLNKGVDALILAAQGEYKAPEGWANRGNKGGIPIFFVILAVIVFLVIISAMGGKGGGGYVSRRGYSDWGGWPGGGSSGGFGGFGGGGFGGGGASGKW